MHHIEANKQLHSVKVIARVRPCVDEETESKRCVWINGDAISLLTQSGGQSYDYQYVSHDTRT